MTRIRIILHGKAAGNMQVRAAVTKLRAEGHEIGVRVTWEAGDARRLAREAVEDARREKIERIVAGGGDGTFNEVFASAWLASPPAYCSFGILPLGTANDFAHSTDIPTQDPEAALRLIVSTSPRLMDVGLLNGAPFFNLVSGGFGSQVTAQTDPALKRHVGGLAYVLSGLSRLKDLEACRGRFRTDDFEWEGRFLAFALGNGRQAGGGISLCPAACLDDGQIDLFILPEVLRDARARAMHGLLLEGPESLEKLAVRTRSDRIFFEADEDVSVNLDGEPRQVRHCQIECRARALPVHVGSHGLFCASADKAVCSS
ncbi:lipid kinase YegS [Altericroceibacterium spongiae]|uniref:Lipid kinase YegS n=1 Tax=Altericroceibacterium spongiae TaxID=2320269 RepID=A0A420EAF6_9SPHN|nr:lipid kinase YegS [Altericroceibacterium spongiae]RKF17666.1 lipid kinase YegS [Altericroceibacterium spongiae]